MAEYAPPRADDAIWRREHLPSAQSVLIELHRLVSIFFASRGFAESIAAPDGHGEELGDGLFLLQECEDDEISRILLTVAVVCRSLDDAYGNIVNLVAGDCGTLARDIERNPDAVEPLTLREACNKIIHASRRNSDVERTPTGRRYLTPTLYFYGELNGREWKATLDVVAFARDYSSIIRQL